MSAPLPPFDRRDEDGPDVTAGEYVLGLLNPEAHAAAARRVQGDAAFAAEVAEWEARLTPLSALIPERAPPERVWRVVEGRLSGKVARLPRLWDSPEFWRGATATALAAAAACLILVVVPKVPHTTPAQPSGTVSIARMDAPGQGGVAFVATLDEAQRTLTVTATSAAGDQGRARELWLMPPKSKPVSLGLFSGSQPLVVAAPAGVAPGAELGVSLEPAGGSPSGRPTGPVLATGVLMRI